jgi:hypothetical protein
MSEKFPNLPEYLERPKTRCAWWLSIAGLIPFAALFLCLLIGTPEAFTENQAAFALLVYAATILSFLGGIQWGIAVKLTGDARLAARIFCFSIMPSLTGWCSVLLTAEQGGLWITAIALVAILAVDRLLFQLEMIPEWFFIMRKRISLSAASLTALAALAY